MLNPLGSIVSDMILQIENHYSGVVVDKYVVMPNHVHMIIVIQQENDCKGLDKIVGLFKSGVTREIRKNNPEMKVWQRSFHDHVIRNEAGYLKIWEYIDNNPKKWELDCFYRNKEE